VELTLTVTGRLPDLRLDVNAQWQPNEQVLGPFAGDGLMCSIADVLAARSEPPTREV
jgi:hypothetical protein